jgi:hypothetical protein
MAGCPTDRLSWTTLVDHYTLDILPTPLRGMDALGFYRHIRCDILQLGGIQGCRLVMPGLEVIVSTDEAGHGAVETRCPRGVLRGRTSRSGHPVEYPVKTIEDIRLYTKRWEGAYYEEVDERAEFAAIEAAVGDDGITTLFMPPSAIPHLLEEAMGIEGFYYLMSDYPDEVDTLIRVIQEKELSRFALCADGPCSVLILTENTSTRYIGPQIYARYNMPSQRAFVEAVHNRGKTAILHMCGHVRDLLPIIRETHADGIHALTPPPLGDTPWELALDVLGEDLIIMGALTPDIFQTCPLDEVGPCLDKLVTPRLRESRFVLNPFSDGIPTPIERFLAVRDWVEGRTSQVTRMGTDQCG